MLVIYSHRKICVNILKIEQRLQNIEHRSQKDQSNICNTPT
jgi:hypothetical protein